jgi:hypothetical protein
MAKSAKRSSDSSDAMARGGSASRCGVAEGGLPSQPAMGDGETPEFGASITTAPARKKAVSTPQSRHQPILAAAL